MAITEHATVGLDAWKMRTRMSNALNVPLFAAQYVRKHAVQGSKYNARYALKYLFIYALV
jgi:hypothetical protein